MCSRRVSISSDNNLLGNRGKKILRKTERIHCHLRYGYFANVKQTVITTVEFCLPMTSTDFGIACIWYHYDFILCKNFWRKSQNPIILWRSFGSNKPVYPGLISVPVPWHVYHIFTDLKCDCSFCWY
jgi:hypothetical protein